MMLHRRHLFGAVDSLDDVAGAEAEGNGAVPAETAMTLLDGDRVILLVIHMITIGGTGSDFGSGSNA